MFAKIHHLKTGREIQAHKLKDDVIKSARFDILGIIVRQRKKEINRTRIE